MDIQRTILFVALGLVSMLLMQNWQTYQTQKNPITIEQSSNNLPSVAGSVNAAGDIPNSPAAAQINSSEGVPAIANSAATAVNVPLDQSIAKGKQIEITTDVLSIKIDTLGGSITYAGLLQHPIKLNVPEDPVVLLQNSAAERYLAQSGLTDSATQNLPNHHTQFTASQSNYDLATGDTLEVPLSYTSPDGVVYTKIFSFARNSYRIGVRYVVENKSATPWSGHFYGQLLRTEPSDAGAGSILTGKTPSYTGGAYYTPEALYTKLKFSDMSEDNLSEKAPSGWAAMLQHYFVGAWLPETESEYRFYSKVNKNTPLPEYKLGFLGLKTTQIAPGASGELSAAFYVGPKERDRLDAQGAEGLNLTVDYGWLTVIAEPLFWVMRKIHGIVGNWGWTIILITLLIKAIFLPLSAASYKSMAKMKRLSPRLKTLKERYGDDKQKFQSEMMKLYKEEKVNPAGGCLPILVQIPVFIALYWVLLESVELRQAPWAFWIHDLSSKDPFYILPVIMGASMVIQQLLNPAPMEQMQKNIMMALPVVFTIFFLSFPAGLVLYWVVNNVLSILQQWLISRRYQ